jgi:exodeoxyribonuclease-3
VLLATWNVNGIRARSQRLAEWLQERQPDVVCLQELKIAETDFPHLELLSSGYHAVLSGQQSWNGVAVLAKERPEIVMRALPARRRPARASWWRRCMGSRSRACTSRTGNR